MKSKMPQVGEAVFCIIYLIFGLVAGIYMISFKDSQLIFLYGVLTLVLAGGDSFHLVPRIINAFKDRFEGYEFWAGLGLLVSSVTMTVFYVILYYICELMAPEVQLSSIIIDVLLALTFLRIVFCLCPQNNWFHKEGNSKWGIIRNVPFVFIGIIMIGVSIAIGRINLAIAILVSFACYLPVVLWAKEKPMIGMLMIPKTIAYMWMICMGLAMCM